jgi:predicted ATP-dependent Lon-type protease
MKPKDIDQSAAWDCKSIPSFQSMHFMAFVSPRNITLLKLRHLACFFPNYMDDDAKFCENKSHVPPWKLLTLEPTNVTQL